MKYYKNINTNVLVSVQDIYTLSWPYVEITQEEYIILQKGLLIEDPKEPSLLLD